MGYGLAVPGQWGGKHIQRAQKEAKPWREGPGRGRLRLGMGCPGLGVGVLVGKGAVVRGVSRSEAQSYCCPERRHPLLSALIATTFPRCLESVNTPAFPTTLNLLRLETRVTGLCVPALSLVPTDQRCLGAAEEADSAARLRSKGSEEARLGQPLLLPPVSPFVTPGRPTCRGLPYHIT